jgi:hypothetical protein
MPTDARLRTLNRDVRITLTCGCTIRARNSPISKRVRYGCDTGASHGYNLAWTAWERVAGPVDAEASR